MRCLTISDLALIHLHFGLPARLHPGSVYAAPVSILMEILSDLTKLPGYRVYIHDTRSPAATVVQSRQKYPLEGLERLLYLSKSCHQRCRRGYGKKIAEVVLKASPAHLADLCHFIR